MVPAFLLTLASALAVAANPNVAERAPITLSMSKRFDLDSDAKLTMIQRRDTLRALALTGRSNTEARNPAFDSRSDVFRQFERDNVNNSVLLGNAVSCYIANVSIGDSD